MNSSSSKDREPTQEFVASMNAKLAGTKFDWRITTPPSLRGHIVNQHLSPAGLAAFGVARYDIELSYFLQVPLDWVVKKAFQQLEESDSDVRVRLRNDASRFQVAHEGGFRELYDYWSIPGYKTMLVRDLMYIEKLGLARIDWPRALATVPLDHQPVTLDLERDCRDTAFRFDRLF